MWIRSGTSDRDELESLIVILFAGPASIPSRIAGWRIDPSSNPVAGNNYQSQNRFQRSEIPSVARRNIADSSLHRHNLIQNNDDGFSHPSVQCRRGTDTQVCIRIKALSLDEVLLNLAMWPNELCLHTAYIARKEKRHPMTNKDGRKPDVRSLSTHSPKLGNGKLSLQDPGINQRFSTKLFLSKSASPRVTEPDF